jgi:chemotaxis protein MotB
MKLSLFPIALVAVAIMSQGCISTKKYTQLQTSYGELEAKNKDLNIKFLNSQQELSVANTRVKSLEEQIAAGRSNLSALQAALDKCLTSSGQGNVNISKLVDEINSSNKYIQQLVNSKNKSDSLNMVLTNNLTRSLSQQESKDVNVQVLKGVVYVSLSDNMLYKSGSYEISDKAGETLSKIAKIITDYKDYDVLIEGNTDAQPISKPNIRNNWDLSALRAASVVMSLQTTYGVDPKRLTAGGRGEFNPLASNDTEAGRSRNRRTQIIITPKLDQFMELIDKAPEKK